MRPHTRLQFVTGLVILLTLGAAGTYLWQVDRAQREKRQSTLEEAERRAAQLASATATHVEELIRGIDLGLQQLRSTYGGGNAAAFEQTVRSVLGTVGGGVLDQVSMVGSDGNLLYHSGGLPGPVNISDREHFRFHAEGGADRLHIGQPVKSRITGRWIIPVTRPMQRAGRFAGIANILIFPDQLSAQLARIALTPADAVVLLRADGRFLARNREWERYMGLGACRT